MPTTAYNLSQIYLVHYIYLSNKNPPSFYRKADWSSLVSGSLFSEALSLYCVPVDRLFHKSVHS